VIIGILGQLMSDQRVSMPGFQRPSPCGNGKTVTMTHFLYQEFIQKEANVITNFHTRHIGTEWGAPSWSTYMPSQQIFENWFDIEDGTWIGITELQSLINSAGRSAKLITYIEKCLQQRRKSEFSVIWDSQSLGSSDKRWRDATDYIYRPEKWHCKWSPDFECFTPSEPCPLDICHERHQILVYQEYPAPATVEEMLKPQLILNAWEIGQLFDTKEKMKDSLHYNPAWGEDGN
jgi:hypothetical protein